MKKIKLIFAIIILVIGLNSCSKNDETVTPPPPPAKSEFLYAEGAPTGFIPASDPIALAASKEIFGRNGVTEVVKIKLTSLTVGTYSIGVGNEFTYTRPTTSSPWVAGTGNVIITSNTGTKITGTFDLNSGTSTLGINEVHGKFSDITIN